MNNTKRVIYNTGFLYGKMLISIFVSLYSTRLILNTLGAEDYGIFNLVAGVIAMLSFLNAAMTTSTQRYLSYYLGANQLGKLKEIFKTSVTLHLIIGLGIVLLLELAGTFLFNGFLNIPVERIHSAKIIYHFMVISTFFTINAVPYDSAINAHEDLFFDALSGILENILKLGIAISLLYSTTDKLIVYGLLITLTTIIIRIIKSVFCIKRYPETKIKNLLKIDTNLFRDMFSFAGWNLFGAICGMTRGQGLAIILNLFFGTIVNAAYAISNQVNGVLSSFTMNMVKALNPQIIKNEGTGDRDKMLELAMYSSKYSFLLMAFFSLPSILEMRQILNLWLVDYPENTLIFCQLTLIGSLINLQTIGLQTAVQATGNIKKYQMIVGSTILFNLPLSFFLLKLGLPSYWVLISFCCIEFTACTFRLLIASSLTGLNIVSYLKKVIVKTLAISSISILASTCSIMILNEGIVRLLLTIVFSSICFVLSFYLWGIESNEKKKIDSILQRIWNQITIYQQRNHQI